MRLERKINYVGMFLGLSVVAGYVVALCGCAETTSSPVPSSTQTGPGEEQENREAVSVQPPSPDNTPAAEPSSAEAGKVVARLNGEPIYEEQLNAQVEARLAKFRAPGLREMQEKRPEQVRLMQKAALDKMIPDKLIRQEAGKLAIEDMDDKVEQKVKALEQKHGAGERIEKYLKMRNMTMESLRESYKTRVRIDEYLKQQGILEPEIAEERIREAYDRDPESYSSQEAIRASHILIGVDPQMGAEEKAQARQEAERIREEILGGKDFAEMARESSDCNSASGGGELGYLKRGYMPAEFDEAAFALEKDAVSEVVETKFGYHIIKLSDKQPAGVVPYEDVRDFIMKYLQQEESKTKLAEHVAELKSKAKIEILLPE